MKIYTRNGDGGRTSLFGGNEVDKDHPRVAAYGTVDEANAVLGWVLSASPPDPIAQALPELMSDLFDLGAELATPPGDDQGKLDRRLDSRIDAAQIEMLEGLIDAADAQLEPLKSFVLPTGTEAASRLHLARTVIRRAERMVVALDRDGAEAVRPEIHAYLNRLSDLAFIWARLANALAGEKDRPWQGKKGQ
jgi:cob(I)alamin adenosyltransferase